MVQSRCRCDQALIASTPPATEKPDRAWRWIGFEARESLIIREVSMVSLA